MDKLRNRTFTVDDIDIRHNTYFSNNKNLFMALVDIVKRNPSYATWEIRKNKQLMGWMHEQIPVLSGFNASVIVYANWILTGRISVPTCKICGKPLPVATNLLKLYSEYCSAKCRANDPLYKKYMENVFEEKYGDGIRHNFMIPGVREKAQATLKRNYGNDHPFKNPEIAQKKRNTYLKNYGASHNMKSEKGMAEYRKSMNDKYGVDYTWQVDDVKEKARQSTFDHFGVYVSSRAESVKEKQTQTNIKLYGKKCVLQNEGVHRKTVATLLETYGGDHPSRCPEIRKKQIYNWYEYGGEKFNSSWELAYWIYCLENGIQIEHEPIALEYNDNQGKHHMYFPDFRINGTELVEIKGDDQFDKNTGKMIDKLDESKNGVARAKYECMVSNNVKIMKYNEIKPYLKYIRQKYGKKYLNQFKKQNTYN